MCMNEEYTDIFFLLCSVLEQVKNQCTVQNVNFVVTLKGYKNAAGEEVCGADPGITCPA